MLKLLHSKVQRSSAFRFNAHIKRKFKNQFRQIQVPSLHGSPNWQRAFPGTIKQAAAVNSAAIRSNNNLFCNAMHSKSSASHVECRCFVGISVSRMHELPSNNNKQSTERRSSYFNVIYKSFVIVFLRCLFNALSGAKCSDLCKTTMTMRQWNDTKHRSNIWRLFRVCDITTESKNYYYYLHHHRRTCRIRWNWLSLLNRGQRNNQLYVLLVLSPTFSRLFCLFWLKIFPISFHFSPFMMTKHCARSMCQYSTTETVTQFIVQNKAKTRRTNKEIFVNDVLGKNHTSE